RQVRMIRRAISPRLAISSVSIMCLSWQRREYSHPEDPEATGALHGVGMADRQRDAEHGPGVPGIDHAVVEQLPAHVRGERLRLDPGLELGPLGRVGLLVELPPG